MKKPALGAAIFILIAMLFFGAWLYIRKGGNAGGAHITVTVEHRDAETASFELEPGSGYLEDIILDTGLAYGEESDGELIIYTMDGESVDIEKGERWECTADGEVISLKGLKTESGTEYVFSVRERK